MSLRESLRAVSSTFTWSVASAVSNSVWSSERSGADRAAVAAAGLSGTPSVLVARGLLQLGEPSKPSACEKRTTVLDESSAPGQLLGRLEGRLVEMVDDVLGDILLRARELVEAGPYVGGERLVTTAARTPF